MIERYTLPPMNIIWDDENKYGRWVESCLAVLFASASLKDIPASTYEAIKENASFKLRRVKKLDDKFNQDAQALIEAVKEELRKARLHEADIAQFGNNVTSYDMEDPALSRLICTAADEIVKELQTTAAAFRRRAKEFKDTYCMAITHHQPAGITLLGLRFCSFVAMLERDIARIGFTRDELEVGKFSGAFGVYDELDPEIEEIACKYLELEPDRISTQIIHRDRHAALMGVLAVCAGNIEHINNCLWEMCYFGRSEARTYFDPDNRGSTAMPHKINPWRLERGRGQSSLIRGYQLAVYEQIKTSDERAIDQSSVERVAWADSTTLLHFMVINLRKVFQKMVFFSENMLQNIKSVQGVTSAQYVKNMLRRKGISRLTFTTPEGKKKRPQTYDWVKYCSQLSWDIDQGRSVRHFRDVLEEQGIGRYLTKEELDQCFDWRYHLRNTKVIYKRFGI